MKLKFLILVSCSYIDIYSSDKPHQKHHGTAHELFLPEGYQNTPQLYNMRDPIDHQIQRTAITFPGSTTRSTSSFHLQENLFDPKKTTPAYPNICLTDEDPIEKYLQSKKEKRCCLFACILKLLGM